MNNVTIREQRRDSEVSEVLFQREEKWRKEKKRTEKKRKGESERKYVHHSKSWHYSHGRKMQNSTWSIIRGNANVVRSRIVWMFLRYNSLWHEIEQKWYLNLSYKLSTARLEPLSDMYRNIARNELISHFFLCTEWTICLCVMTAFT